MSKLARVIRKLKFDKDDVKAMDEAFRRVEAFIEALHTDDPSASVFPFEYVPVLILALLKSQAILEKLTYCIIGLTCVLGVLAIVQIVLMVC